MTISNSSFDINNSSLIEGLMQTIGSLDSIVRSLRDELASLREMDAEHNAERKRLMAMIEAKDQDISPLTKHMAQLLGKVDALTKALEDKSHQLANRNRDKFGTKTNRNQEQFSTMANGNDINN